MDDPKPSRQPRWWLYAALTLLALTVPLWAGYEQTGMPMDEGIALLYPELVFKGAVPYRDFETYYAPANLWVLGSVYSIFGAHITVERTVGLAYRLLLLLGVFFVGRRWGVIAAVSSTVLTGIMLMPTNLLAFAWLGGVACALGSLLCMAGKDAPWRAPVAGFLGAAAVLYRQDLGPAVIASALPLLMLFSPKRRWHFTAGFAAGLIPLGILALVAGPKAVFENLFLYPVVITNPARRLPLWLMKDDPRFIFYLNLGTSVLGLIAGALAWHRDRRSQDSRLFLAVSILAAALAHQCMQRTDAIHILQSAFLSIGLLPITLLVLLRNGRIAIPAIPWSLGTASAVGAFLFFFTPQLCQYTVAATKLTLDSDLPKTEFITVRNRSFPYGLLADPTRAVVRFLEKQTRPGERLFVGTGDLRRTFANDTFIYHLLPWLTPATYFLEMNPLSANRPDSRLASDIASADWLVLNHMWDDADEPNLCRQNGSDEPNEIVRKQFDLCGRSWPLEIYHRKAKAPPGAVALH